MAGSSPRRPRSEFTDQDRDYIIKYLAKYTAEPQGRSGNAIWKTLVENKRGKWNWSYRHTWQSWRNHYTKEREWFDYKVKKYQQKHPAMVPLPSPRNGTSSTPRKVAKRERTSFTASDDDHLAEYLAEHSLTTDGRLGNKLYKTLVENEDEWPWAERHTMHSWRERYRNRRDFFDERIVEHQRDHPAGAILETPAGARTRRRKAAAKARPEADESTSEEEPEQLGEVEQEGEQAIAAVAEIADEEHEVEEAIQEPGEHSGSSVSRQTNGPSGASRRSREKRRRPSGLSDDAGPSRTAKRRRVGAQEDAPAGLATIDEGGVGQGGNPAKADAINPAGDAQQSKPRNMKRIKRTKQGRVGVPPPLDDYAGNIFDASQSSGSDTEDEEQNQEQERPPIAVKREEEEAEEGGEEEEEDQLVPSVDGSHERPTVDDARGSVRQALIEPPSPDGTPSPTTVDRARTQIGQLYPNLPSPSPPVVDAQDLPLPGRFPATFTSGDVRGASVFSEAIPLPHELLVKAEEETKLMTSGISQNPTPPASSPPADVNRAVSRSQSPTGLRRSVEPDTVADPAQLGVPNADTTPRARPPANKYTRKPSEDIFTSVTTTPVIASSRDATPSMARTQEKLPKRPREPPRLRDGPYNHVFTDAMGRTQSGGARATGVTIDEGSDREDGRGDIAEWPPRRGRDKGKGKEKPRPMSSRLPMTSVTKVKTESQDSTAALRQLGAPYGQAHHPFSQPTQDLEASQNSQGHVSQSQHHPFSQPSQRVDDATPKWLQSSQSRAREIEPARPFKLPKAHLDRLEQELMRHGHLLRPEAPGKESRREGIITSTPVRRDLKRLHVPDESIPGPSIAGPPVPEGLAIHFEPIRSVRFDASLPNAKGKERDYGPTTPHPKGRRYTVEGSTASQAQPRDDNPSRDHVHVRQSLPLLPSAPHGVRSADDSFVGTSSTSFSFRRPRKRESLSFVQQPKPRSASAEPEPPIQICEDDENVVVHIGVETAIQTMSENHGFNPEIVRRVWSQTQSLRKTDAVLRQMREAAEKAALLFMESLEDADGGDTVAHTGPSTRVPSPTQGEAPRRSSHKRQTSILHITPLQAEPEESSEYSPPRPTRAGQYVRLVKEGREYEAVAREFSSAAGISQLRTPQKFDSDADYQATGGSPDATMDHYGAPDDDTTLESAWVAEQPVDDASQLPPLWNVDGNAAKIELGKKLGQMLAHVDV